MIIPSIDIQGGHAVQLEGGKALKIDAGDPVPWARRFAVAGEVAVIDLDAAMGKGNNREVIEPLLRLAPCRVGGGIRDVSTALDWLDRGAAKVILGTAARSEILRELPRERVIAALDAVDGEVMVEGWRAATGQSIEQRIKELSSLVGGFLITFIEREGRMVGIDPSRLTELVQLVGNVRITFAGGVTTAKDVGDIDHLGADAQVGMALYSGRLDLGEAIAAPIKSDRADGLMPTVVADVHGGVLGLAYSSLESLREAVRTGRGVYQSRTRGLWRKGETSGDTQDLVRIGVDCDRDTLLFVVRQQGRGFCHLGTPTCFGDSLGISALWRVLEDRQHREERGSYTRRVLDDPQLLAAKLEEEVGELISARGVEEVVHEAADVLYFTLVRLLASGATLEQVEEELARRGRRVRRRGGDAKSSDQAP